LKKSRFTDEQIAHALRQAEAGTPVAEITRRLGVSEATFYAWKKKFGSLGTAEIRELRQLREENSKLKRLVADLSLDKTMLQDVISRKWQRRCAGASLCRICARLIRLANDAHVKSWRSIDRLCNIGR
jgi:putative transposase